MNRPAESSLQSLVDDARRLIATGERRILGITGAPGAGKSTLATQIVAALADQAVQVSLDGFHLANTELRRLGLYARKGAANTFDATGYRDLLKRLRERADATIYTALFDRALDESIACAVPVPRYIPLVVTEGNYLLVDEDPWRGTADLLDECWYIDPGENVRLERLIARHVHFGRSPKEAEKRSLGSDQRNAELIASTRARADRIIRVPDIFAFTPPVNAPRESEAIGAESVP